MAQDLTAISLNAESEPLCPYTPSATSNNTIEDSQTFDEGSASIPWPGQYFIIRSRTIGHVITFFNRKIILAQQGGLGILRWRCIQKNGWLGFQDPASSMYLGYDEAGWLCCASYKHSEQEYVCPRKRPEGGYVLLVLVEKEPSPIGVRSTDTVDQIKIRDWKSESIMWDFIEI